MVEEKVANLVIDVAVCEHCVEVLDTFLGIPVVIVLETLFYRPHVHRSLDDLIVVLHEGKPGGGKKTSHLHVRVICLQLKDITPQEFKYQSSII